MKKLVVLVTVLFGIFMFSGSTFAFMDVEGGDADATATATGGDAVATGGTGIGLADADVTNNIDNKDYNTNLNANVNKNVNDVDTSQDQKQKQNQSQMQGQLQSQMQKAKTGDIKDVGNFSFEQNVEDKRELPNAPQVVQPTALPDFNADPGEMHQDLPLEVLMSAKPMWTKSEASGLVNLDKSTLVDWLNSDDVEFKVRKVAKSRNENVDAVYTGVGFTKDSAVPRLIGIVSVWADSPDADSVACFGVGLLKAFEMNGRAMIVKRAGSKKKMEAGGWNIGLSYSASYVTEGQGGAGMSGTGIGKGGIEYEGKPFGWFFIYE